MEPEVCVSPTMFSVEFTERHRKRVIPSMQARASVFECFRINVCLALGTLHLNKYVKQQHEIDTCLRTVSARILVYLVLVSNRGVDNLCLESAKPSGNPKRWQFSCHCLLSCNSIVGDHIYLPFYDISSPKHPHRALIAGCRQQGTLLAVEADADCGSQSNAQVNIRSSGSVRR